MTGGPTAILEDLFKRRFWLVIMAAIAVVTYLLTQGLNGQLSARLAHLTVATPAMAGASSANDGAEEADDASLIARLLMVAPDPPVVVEPVVPSPPVVTEPPPATTDGALDVCPLSSIEAVLVGTMVDRSSRWSYGIVQDRRANRTALVRPGMMVAGATVVAVERQRIWVDNDGRRECLLPNQEPAEPPVEPVQAPVETPVATPRPLPERPPAGAQPSPSPQPSGYGVNEFRDAIRRSGPSEYTVERSAIDAAVADSRALRGHAPQVEQHLDGGRPSGIAIRDIPDGSIFADMGLRAGDVLKEVNGSRLTTLQRAPAVFEALTAEGRVTIVLERRGRSRTLTYLIE